MYSRINGTPSCANNWLMNAVARKEWGFKGFFISDAGAILFQVKISHNLLLLKYLIKHFKVQNEGGFNLVVCLSLS